MRFTTAAQVMLDIAGEIIGSDHCKSGSNCVRATAPKLASAVLSKPWLRINQSSTLMTKLGKSGQSRGPAIAASVPYDPAILELRWER
jgi:hypothetical protein